MTLARVYTALREAADLGQSGLFTADVRVAVAHPVNECADISDASERFFHPLLRALPDLERRPLIAVAGLSGDAIWEIGTGFLTGTFTQALLGIPPSRRPVWLRYTEMVRFEGEAIAEYYLIPDFIDLMNQVGVNPLRPSLGAAAAIQVPATQDGLFPSGTAEAAAESRALVLDMLANLGEYDGESLTSMALERFWHPDFVWYGPGGIGTTRGIAGFRTQHQGPFLKAFPDRVVDHHAATVAAGSYAATGGWPHMHASHLGGGWLGLPASGRHLSLRVMDIWRRDGGLLIENWVGIDIAHMLAQMDVDVFEQMQLLC